MSTEPPPKKILRSDDDLYLIHHTEYQILGAKLPSNQQVLAVFLHNRQLGFSIEDSAILVVREIEIFWSKARIPTSYSSYCRIKVIKLHEEWLKLKKGTYTHKSSKHDHKEKEFKDKLDDLFDIAHSNALNVLKGDAKEFLLSQRKKGRVGSLAGIDKKGEEKEAKQLKRTEEEEKRRRKSAIELKEQCNSSEKIIFLCLNFETNTSFF